MFRTCLTRFIRKPTSVSTSTAYSARGSVPWTVPSSAPVKSYTSLMRVEHRLFLAVPAEDSQKAKADTERPKGVVVQQ